MTRIANYLVNILILLILILSIIWSLGFRLNTTDSIPRGMYQYTKTSKLKNNYIIFCPEKSEPFKTALLRGYISPGLCVSGMGQMMKKVVATSGDIISITKEGVFVNNKLLPYSKPLSFDGAGQKLPKLRLTNYRLKPNELLTMTDQDKWSFDGRYYGLINISQVKGAVKKIWVKPKIRSRNI